MNIIKDGKTLMIFNDITIIQKLENKNYLIKETKQGLILEETTELKIPDKVYDSESKFRNMILKSFFAGNKSNGVLLEGYKGMGKSITAKQLCIESKLPVIIIDKPINLNSDLISFLNTIEQDFILFIDEFEKIFKDSLPSLYEDGVLINNHNNGYHNQDSFLTIMDGVLSNNYKKLFIFTSNTSINDKFMNRPSRIKWYKKYEFLDSEQYTMIIDNLLEIKEFKEDLILNLSPEESTIDILISIINEINTLQLPYSEFKKLFNYVPKKINYELYRLDNNEFKLVSDIELSNNIFNRNIQYINNISIEKIISLNNDELTFTTRQVFNVDVDAYKLYQEGKMKNLDITYKIKEKSKINTLVL